jgi:hypothetical protein
MLKTISAALLAASVISAPAFAAEAGKTTTAPVIKADQSQTKASTTAAKPDTAIKPADVKADAKVDTKSKAMNANAAVTADEHKAVRTHRHHHKHLSAKKLKAQPDATKPLATEKRS